ncbi:MAG: GMP synthase [Rhodothermales bacterium]|nr:GMP synthase [Rhodothermales bacterium]
MTRPSELPIRIAVLDLNNGEKNLGLGAIKGILSRFSGKFQNTQFECSVFDVRGKGEIPGVDFDIFVSSGGPGSPFDGEGKAWERDYFDLIDRVWRHNQRRVVHGVSAKHVLFICHSFQLMVRHFELAQVAERRSPSFGVFPIHPVGTGFHDPLFAGLTDPFFAADFRHWQVVSKSARHMEDLGAKVIAREKIRPEVRLERAIMAIRVSPELVGVQFHPEADPIGMLKHFEQPERLRKIVEDHGHRKYQRIIGRLDDPQYLAKTYAAVLPNFLHEAIGALRGIREAQVV